MNIGMLWFDNDPKTGLESKVNRAAQYYRDKYGKIPTLCYVHPCMLTQDNNGEAAIATDDQTALVTGGIEVRINQTVLPNHFWIGVNGKVGTSAN